MLPLPHCHRRFGGRTVDDQYNLQHFVDAQQPLYAAVCAELMSGQKRSHWMWFIFPQIRGLGSSEPARRFAISSLQEASAYLKHPVLGPSLRECATLVNAVEGRTVTEIFGYPDDMKLRSSMTLFSQAHCDNQVFIDCLLKYFDGRPDLKTLALL